MPAAKPTVAQVAWVFQCLEYSAVHGHTFRQLIYDLMGFDATAYHELYCAGGQGVMNSVGQHPEEFGVR